MTDEELQAIRERVEAATHGVAITVSHQYGDDERHYFEVTGYEGSVPVLHWEADYDTPCFKRGQADAFLFAFAQRDTTALLAEVDALREIARAVAEARVGEAWYEPLIVPEGVDPGDLIAKARTLLGIGPD